MTDDTCTGGGHRSRPPAAARARAAAAPRGQSVRSRGSCPPARALPPPDPVPDVPPLAGGLPDVGAKLVAGNKAVGELVAVDAASSVAVAMLKLDFALSGEVLDVDVEGGQGVKASPYVPPWWPGDVLTNAD